VDRSTVTKHPQDRLGLLVERIRAQAAEFFSRNLDVRTGDGEAIHDQRVAVRRLRSCLKTFRRAFEPEPSDHLVIELTWIGGLLGAARDAQVIADEISDSFGRTRHVLGDLSQPERSVPQTATAADEYRALADEITWIGGLLGVKRTSPVGADRIEKGIDGVRRVDDDVREARSALDAALMSDRYGVLLDEIAAFAFTPPFRSGDRGNRWLVRRLRREIEQTTNLVGRALTSTGSARDAALHEVRKGAKRVRYAAETLEPRYGKKARRIVSTFESIQATLGTHHDAIVTQAVLSERLSIESDLPAEVGGSELLDRERDRARESDAAFAAAWPRIAVVVRRRWPMA
jgi:CHAD domain-containing protein